MSEPLDKLFVFTENETNRILLVKRSRGLDFRIHSQSWNCFEVSSNVMISIKTDSNNCWTPSLGVQPAFDLKIENADEVALLKKKLDILVSMKANLHVMWMQMKPQLSLRRVMEISIQQKNIPKFWRLVSAERRMLKRKMADFFLSFQDRIEKCSSLEALDREYQSIVNNTTLGGYSGLSRDLEESHVKRN